MPFSISNLDVLAYRAGQELWAIVEADIRSAHGETVDRPIPSNIPGYIYEAAIHQQDTDRRDYESEVEAQMMGEAFPEG
jgi:hypothetical protein